jgi:hypothetical protein
MTNGNKAAATRAKKAKEGSAKGSQLKAVRCSTSFADLMKNEAAKSIVCQTCRSTFLVTASASSLAEHSMNKHNKSAKECFPTAAV